MQNLVDKLKAEVRKELGIQSNADRIREMNDEELAVFLDDNFCHRYCCGERVKQATLDWLQSEAE